jgi:hypothetical protein
MAQEWADLARAGNRMRVDFRCSCAGQGCRTRTPQPHPRMMEPLVHLPNGARSIDSSETDGQREREGGREREHRTSPFANGAV